MNSLKLKILRMKLIASNAKVIYNLTVDIFWCDNLIEILVSSDNWRNFLFWKEFKAFSMILVEKLSEIEFLIKIR